MSCARIVALVSFSLSAFAWSPAIADQKCQLTQYASLDLGTDPSGGVFVPVTINGHSENLLVDTGGAASMLSKTTVQNLGLETMPVNNGGRFILGGSERLSQIAVTNQVQLGSMVARNMRFLVAPDYVLHANETGSLAPDVMSNYDIELDFAKAKLNIFSSDHCPEQVVYWTRQPYAEVTFHIDRDGHIVMPVQLDGKTIPATFDTGASMSHLNFESAQALYGWSGRPASLEVLKQQKEDRPAVYHYPFKSLIFAGVTVANPYIVLDSLNFSDQHLLGVPPPNLLIGMGILRQMHIYIAYHENNIYFTSAEAH